MVDAFCRIYKCRSIMLSTGKPFDKSCHNTNNMFDKSESDLQDSEARIYFRANVQQVTSRIPSSLISTLDHCSTKTKTITFFLFNRQAFITVVRALLKYRSPMRSRWWKGVRMQKSYLLQVSSLSFLINFFQSGIITISSCTRMAAR